MIRILAVLALFTFPFGVQAKPVSVKSGEHEDFSRLVLLFDEIPDWSFGRVEGGYELRTAMQDAEFVLDQVFRFIPRDRIAKIEPDGRGSLVISVTCECHADAFEIRSRLVVDIKDGPPNRHSQFEAFLPNPAAAPAETIAGPSASPSPQPRPDSIARASPLYPRFQGAARESDLLPFRYSPKRTSYAWQRELDNPVSGAAADLAANSRSSEAVLRLQKAQSDLIAEIGRAASQGLVDPNLEPTENLLAKNLPVTIPPNTSNDPAGSHETSRLDHPNSPFAADFSNLRVKTAADRSGPNEDNAQSDKSDGTTCLPSTVLDIANWGSPPDQGSKLSDYRSGIVGEFDQIDPQRIETLVKHYIYLTFGAEAKSLLSVFDIPIPNKNILMALADIMDDGIALDPSSLSDQTECDSNAALWAILARPSLSKAEKISQNAVLKAFAGLPLHIRRHIGPGLAKRFLEIGDMDSAAAIRNSILRAPGKHGTGFDMMQAEIALASGNEAAANSQLEEIVSGDGPIANEALIVLIDAQLDAGNPVEGRIVEEAAASAFEARGTKQGAELARVYLRAQAHIGKILKTLSAIESAVRKAELPQDIATNLIRETFEVAVTEASDAEFLKAALGTPWLTSPDDQTDQVRRQVSDRLIRLGMTDAARSILSKDETPPTPEDRILYARSFVDEQKADMAMGYLAGLTSPEAKMLQASALAMTDKFGRALDVYEQLGEDQQLARTAWRGRAWARVIAVGTETEREAAQLLLNQTARPASDETNTATLKGSRSLLKQSRESRLALVRLLDEKTLPERPTP
jgi:hypothetical protein